MKLRSRKRKSFDDKPSPAKKAQAVKQAKNVTKRSKTRTTARMEESSKKQPTPPESDDRFDAEDPSWLSSVEDSERRQGFLELDALIQRLAPTLEPTTKFRHCIIGYGEYHYKYKSGREGDHVKLGLANNKQHMALHCCGALGNGKYLVEHYADRLGKCSTGRSCIRFKRLDDLNRTILEELISTSASCDYCEEQ